MFPQEGSCEEIHALFLRMSLHVFAKLRKFFHIVNVDVVCVMFVIVFVEALVKLPRSCDGKSVLRVMHHHVCLLLCVFRLMRGARHGRWWPVNNYDI